MSHSVLSHGQFPEGSWRPGKGSAPADHGYSGPTGTEERATWQKTFAGELRKRGNDQSANPVIKDAAHRTNVQLHPDSERNGPAGIVCCGRAYSDNQSHTDTGRNVKLLPPAHGNGDFKRAATGGE
jgi:hypothetical protein